MTDVLNELNCNSLRKVKKQKLTKNITLENKLTSSKA